MSQDSRNIKEEEDTMAAKKNPSKITIGAEIGQMVWLMGQSPTHRNLSVADLDWLLYPPIILGQFRIFKDQNKRPTGFAIWGYLNDAAEHRFKNEGKLEANDWCNGEDIQNVSSASCQKDGQPWLIELVTPFHNQNNFHREQCLKELMSSIFSGQKLKLIHIDPKNEKPEEISISG